GRQRLFLGRDVVMERDEGTGPVPAPEEERPWSEEPRERERGRDRGEGGDRTQRAQANIGAIRTDDTEPYIALQYVARLFKIVAMVVIVALTAEIVMGVVYEGTGALLPLIAEVVKGGVLAAILWGVSDLTLLFIDVGHDVRAARVLLGRISARAGSEAAVRRTFADEE
ncbi:MAG TPA: hypothetical protein VFH27_16395, partial [Longimicrobiaceae bacterium]|nr:hypothetical protein [Longimicrobiaceae bacterium]